MVRHRGSGAEVVYVERSADSSAKWLFWGAVLGAGLALLYAPRSGEETRRSLQRRLWKLRAMTEEALDDLAERFGGGEPEDEALLEDEPEDAAAGDLPAAGGRGSPRAELEHRLHEARARRRRPAEPEEPLA